MKTISMLDFRLDAERIIAQVQRGERMILTRRCKAVARLEPIVETVQDGDDPFYSLSELAEPGRQGASLSNAQIDELLYGE